MYNLQRYSSVLLVLIFYFKALTGLPYDAQPAPATQPQLDAEASLTASNHPADTLPIEARNLNVNTSVATRTLPNPAAPQQEDVVARSAFGTENIQPPPAVGTPVGPPNQNEAQQRINSMQLNSSVAGDGTPPYRSGLEGLTSNVSNIEERSLNASSPSSLLAAPNAANDTIVETRSLDLDAASPTVNASSPFVPSFLKNFGLRQKRGEEVSKASETVSSNKEQDSPLNNSPHVAQRSGLEKSPSVSNSDAAAATPPLTLNVAPNHPNVASRSAMVSVDPAARFSFNVPYINVYPVDDVNF